MNRYEQGLLALFPILLPVLAHPVVTFFFTSNNLFPQTPPEVAFNYPFRRTMSPTLFFFIPFGTSFFRGPAWGVCFLRRCLRYPLPNWSPPSPQETLFFGTPRNSRVLCPLVERASIFRKTFVYSFLMSVDFTSRPVREGPVKYRVLRKGLARLIFSPRAELHACSVLSLLQGIDFLRQPFLSGPSWTYLRSFPLRVLACERGNRGFTAADTAFLRWSLPTWPPSGQPLTF